MALNYFKLGNWQLHFVLLYFRRFDGIGIRGICKTTQLKITLKKIIKIFSWSNEMNGFLTSLMKTYVLMYGTYV